MLLLTSAMSKLLASCHAVLCILQICLVAGATEPHFFGGHSNLMRQQPRDSDSPPVYHSSVPLEMQQEYSSSPMDNQMEKMRPTMHYKMPYDNDTTPVMNTILVESAHSSPVNILFRSTSSSVNVLQDHRRSKGIVHYMNSQEEPVVLVMNISKPVIQKVNEKFLPKRYITQEIYPIKETVETIIKDAPRDKYLGDSETHSNEQNSNNAMKPMFHESNHFNNIQNYVNQVRNNIHQSIPRYQHMPEMHHPKSNQESYNQMMGEMNGEEMMNAAGNNQHEEGKSAGLSDTYMADSFNLNDGNRDHLSGEYKARVPRQHSHNSNIEPVYRESQTVYREDKPDRKEDIAVVNEQLNATTVVYDDTHSPANLTASKV